MNWRSHVVVGGASAAGAVVAAGHVHGLHPSLLEDAAMVGSAAFASLWPDGDRKRSKAGQWLPGHAVYGCDGHEGRRFLGVTCWHRRRWHSIGALGIVSAMALLLAVSSGVSWSGYAAIGASLGYASHLVVDLPYGKQMLLWPFSSRLVGWAEVVKLAFSAATRVFGLG